MKLHRYARFTLSAFEEVLLFNLGGLGVAIGALLLFHVPLYDSFGFIILIESTGLMLVGGALGVAGQATTRKITEILTRGKVKPEVVRDSDFKAGLYALTGVLLFAEGGAMALIFA